MNGQQQQVERQQPAPELWRPRHADRLVVGARVRVQLGGECEKRWPEGGTGHADFAEQHGRSGYIFEVDPDTGYGGADHNYRVRYATPYISDPSCTVIGIYCAATELELIADDEEVRP